jgi:terminal uridylyltransferase
MTVLESLVQHFNRVGIDSAHLVRARVPIVRLVDQCTGLHCDVCVWNESALVNTGFVDRHVKLSPCCLPLLKLIKFWAKRRGINEPFLKTLNSFTLNLLVIHYLQQARVLPVFGSTFFQTSKNSLGDLLFGFFQYYSQFDFDKWMVCATNLKLIEKSNRSKKRSLIYVEDPAVPKHNVGYTCSPRGLVRVKQEITRAYDLLCAQQNLKLICEEFNE